MLCRAVPYSILNYSHFTVETKPKDDLTHVLIPKRLMSKISYCFALKKVLGPTGGPRAGGIMTILLLPGFISRSANSKPKSNKLNP